MRVKIQNIFYRDFLKNVNFDIFKKIFFLISLTYFSIYFLINFDEISFKIDFNRNRDYIFLSFLFCIVSIFLNAIAWKNIVIWFGKKHIKNNLISFYVITNVLKYVPGGIWHFFERFKFLKDITNPQIAFYSILIEPYFMLCASFCLASIGIIYSPLYLFLFIPFIFLNSKLIYPILRKLESLKNKTITTLKIPDSNYKFEERIKIKSFFPAKAFVIEICFVFSKFMGFIICFNILNIESRPDTLYLFVIFCLSWSIGLIVPTAPGGIGIFEACFLFFIGENVPQNITLVSLIYFRLISTSADLLLSLPFLLRKVLKRI